MSWPTPLEGRGVKLTALSEVNGNSWASTAELALVSGDVRRACLMARYREQGAAALAKTSF